VTAVSGGESLRRTLGRLLQDRRERGWLEVLVPLESSYPGRAQLVSEFAAAAFPGVDLPAAGVSEHERYDRRRTAGILASRGPVVALVEDHGTPAADWADRVRAAHDALPHAVIGGAVGNGVDAARNDALWLCDFGRYAPPQAAGPRAALTDVNVSYKRDALFAVRDAWDPRYHEPLVHEAMRARGATLWLDPAILVTEERPPMTLAGAIAERVAWGRLFGRLRAAPMPRGRRLLWAAGSLVLAPVLYLRIWRLGRGRLSRSRLLRATPWILVLLEAWCAGEAAGTLTGGYNPLPTKKMG
jgi:hypothetical protein